MPHLPKWVADGVETLMSSQFHPVLVSEIEYLTDELKRVRFVGDLSHTSFTPGQVIEFRVNDNAFRHYTPSFYDRQAGICEVLFYLHGRGPGSHWAANLLPGDAAKLMGPGGKLRFRQEATAHYVFGDESSLGLATHLHRAAWAHGQPFSCLMELTAGNEDWPDLVELPARVVSASSPVSQLTLEQLGWFTPNPHGNSAYYLTGKASSVRVMRKRLVDQGIPKNRIQTQIYWAEGKR
ncbi:MAG: siderophore-interacting protein, partial [Bacteroidota bacterium]